MGSGVGTLAVSFHGGNSPSSITNVLVFPDTGGSFPLLGPGAGSVAMPELREVRTFVVGLDGALYVAVGSGGTGEVLRFVRSAGDAAPWVFDDVFTTAGVSHPFDLCFWLDGTLFVSNQDSDSVTTYDSSGARGPTYIGKLKKVRGLATDGTRLYVADAGSNVLKSYDGSGKHLGDVAVPEPVHLLYGADGWLWIGSESGDAVYAYDPGSPSAGAIPVVEGSDTGIDHTAGLCLLGGSGPSATLLVASRLGRQVLSFPVERDGSGTPRWAPATSTVVLGSDVLLDNPEFVALAPLG